MLGAAGLVVWRLRWPAGFETWVGGPVRSWRRARRVYGRRWGVAIDSAGLQATRHGRVERPQLMQVSSTTTGDLVTVMMLPGQTVDDYAAVADRLAQTFGAQDCRVRPVQGRIHLVELWLLIDDPLVEVVPPFSPDPAALADGVPVARAEDGTVWRLQLVGSHVLVVGATGCRQGVGDLVDPGRPGRADPCGAGAGVGDRPEGRHGTRARRSAVRPLRLGRLDAGRLRGELR